MPKQRDFSPSPMTRKFNGKVYKLWNAAVPRTKREAIQTANMIREAGCQGQHGKGKARVVKGTRFDKGLWVVYRRCG